MTNYDLLAGYAKMKGFSLKSLACEIGITGQSMYLKANNSRDFLSKEILAIQDALMLTDAERDAIFFNRNVSETDTKKK